MKNFFMAILIATVFFLSASPSWAQEAEASADVDVDVSNTLSQTQTQTQTQTQEVNADSSADADANANADSNSSADADITFNNSGTSIGRLPETSTHYIGAAGIPLGSYEKQINQFSISTSIAYICEVTRKNYTTFEKTTSHINGEKVLKKIKKRVRPRPVILKTFSPQEKVFFTYQLPKGAKGEVLGILTYDTKKDKKGDWPVLPSELQMFCANDSMTMGANIVIPLDQFFREHFVPEGMEFSISGLWNWVGLSGNPTGAAISPHGGISKQGNQVIGEAGLTFALLRVENAEELNLCGCEKEDVVQRCDVDEIRTRIANLEKACADCTRLCLNNLQLRKKLGDAYTELYLCIGDSENLKTAIKHYAMAEKNFLSGWDIKSNKAEAEKIVAQVYYNWAGIIRELNGRDVAIKFAQEKNLERIPMGFAKEE